MFEHNEISPFDELISLRSDCQAQQKVISQMINNSTRIQNLLVELSRQHQGIIDSYNKFDIRLMKVEASLDSLEANQKTIASVKAPK
tara:strand:- start:906 stop:1166 length:261 start_codon:yes stop_codon:yes gene_type:complete